MGDTNMTGPASGRAERRSGRLLSPLLRAALVVGILVHLAGFLAFQIISQPLPESAESPPLLEYLSERAFSGEVELEEQAILFDSAPLFVPTRWSASSGLFGKRGFGQWVFPEYEPEIDLLEDLEPVALVVSPASDLQEPEDLLDSRYWDFFLGFGRSGDRPVALPAGGATARVRVLDGVEETTKTFSLTIPSVRSLPARPTLLMVRVDAYGQLIGRPRLTQSSGLESFDQAALGWLRSPGLAARLPAGYLSIRVFP